MFLFSNISLSIDSLKNLSDFLTKEFAENNKKELEEISHDQLADEIGDFDDTKSQKNIKKLKKATKKPRTARTVKEEIKVKAGKTSKNRH